MSDDPRPRATLLGSARRSSEGPKDPTPLSKSDGGERRGGSPTKSTKLTLSSPSEALSRSSKSVKQKLSSAFSPRTSKSTTDEEGESPSSPSSPLANFTAKTKSARAHLRKAPSTMSVHRESVDQIDSSNAVPVQPETTPRRFARGRVSLKATSQRSSPSKIMQLHRQNMVEQSAQPFFAKTFRASTDDDQVYVVFGEPLEAIMERQEATGQESEVPLVVKWTVENLRERAMTVNGIFRQSGHHGKQIALQNLVDSGASRDALQLSEVDEHTVGALLRSYLRSLPDFIVPRMPFFPLLVQVSAFANAEFRKSCYRSILRCLPTCNYNLLQYLALFLRDVSLHTETNLMNVANLSMVFAPTFFGTLDGDQEVRKETVDPASLVKESRFTAMLMEEILSDPEYIFAANAEPALAYYSKESIRPKQKHHMAILRGDTFLVLDMPDENAEVTILMGDNTGKIPQSVLESLEEIPLEEIKTKEIGSLFTNKVVNKISTRSAKAVDLSGSSPKKLEASKRSSTLLRFTNDVLKFSPSTSKRVSLNLVPKS